MNLLVAVGNCSSSWFSWLQWHVYYAHVTVCVYLLVQFTNWKTSLEKSTTSSFIQHQGEKLRKNKKYLNFYCNRSRQSCKQYKTNNTNVRATKSQGIYHTRTLCVKKVPTFKLSVTLSNLNRFSKFAIKPTRHYPSHHRHVATLSWEIQTSNFLQMWKKMQTNCIFDRL